TQLLEHDAAADENSVQARALDHQSMGDGVALRAGEKADQANMTGIPHCPHLAPHRSGTSYFNDAVNTPSSVCFEDLLLPIRRPDVVDTGIRAQLAPSLEFLIARRSHDHARASSLGDLEGEHGNASSTQHQHSLPGPYIAGPHDGVPRRDPGAGQCGAFVVG